MHDECPADGHLHQQRLGPLVVSGFGSTGANPTDFFSGIDNDNAFVGTFAKSTKSYRTAILL